MLLGAGDCGRAFVEVGFLTVLSVILIYLILGANSGVSFQASPTTW